MWLVPLKIVSNVSRFMPGLNLNRGLADLNRGSNSLNSISERPFILKIIKKDFSDFKIVHRCALKIFTVQCSQSILPRFTL